MGHRHARHRTVMWRWRGRKARNCKTVVQWEIRTDYAMVALQVEAGRIRQGP
jgi:hypothetical protein